jgi:hypothetical protein
LKILKSPSIVKLTKELISPLRVISDGLNSKDSIFTLAISIFCEIYEFTIGVKTVFPNLVKSLVAV